MAVHGQLWYLTQGNGNETALVRVNDDGSQSTVVISGAANLGTSFPQEVVVDPASGFYYIISNSGVSGDGAFLLRGNVNSSAAPTVVVDFPDGVIINTLEINPYTNSIYVAYQDGTGSAPANTGIRAYSYSPTTGALTDNGFLTTVSTSHIPQENGFDLLDPLHLALNTSTNTLYYTQLLSGGAESIGLYRLDLSSPNTIVQLVSQTQFPDTGTNGFIIDVEVDASTNKVYFSTESRYPSPDAAYNASQNAIWWVAGDASGATATKVTLTGFNDSSLFYPGDLTFDARTRQLYVESEQGGNASTDDQIYVFQLSADGTSASYVKTISPGLTGSASNIGGLFFDSMAELSASQNTAHAAEQTDYTPLSADPTITDADSNHLANASVKTSGSFAGSGDTLSIAGKTSGQISGTNITIAIVTDGSGNQTMTLSGYDTIAHYQQVLGDIRFVANSDNPTNYGSNTTRTITLQINDGTAGNPAGINVHQHTITIDAVNDAPVLTGDLSATVLEGGTYILSVADLGYTDADDMANGVTFTVSNFSHGTLLVAGSAATTFTQAQLTAGLVSFVHDGGDVDTASFRVSVEDGNEDGSSPTSQTFSLNVTPVNDAPVLAGDLSAAIANAGTYTLTTADLTYIDPDDTAVNVTFTVSNLLKGAVWVDGAESASFTGQQLIDGLVSFHRDGSAGTDASFDVSVEDGNEDSSAPIVSTFEFTVASNAAPTEISFIDTKKTIAENAKTTAQIKLADIAVTDDGQGTNELSLSGADAKYFRLVGDALYLRKGVDLDYEVKTSYSVSVNVNDPTINGDDVELTKNFKLKVSDVNEAPTLKLIQRLDEISETASVAHVRKVADIVVSDDALGSNTLSLAGADANLFRLLNGDLYLKAGAKLDFETNRSLDVIVRVDDKSIGSGFEASRTLHIDVRNVAGSGLESDIDLLASAINSAGGVEAGAGHRSDAGHDQHASGVVDIDHFQF